MVRWSTYDRGPHIVAGVAERAQRVADGLMRNGIDLEEEGVGIVDPRVHWLTMAFDEWAREWKGVAED